MDFDMLVGFLCGINGGTATVYVGQPLDTIKVKMQMYPHLYKNAFSCLINTFKKDGVYRGLYAGTIPALAANISENSVLFCALPPCKRLVSYIIDKPVEKLNPIQNGMAGGCAAVFSGLALCPTELVKCKQQAMREIIEAGNSSIKISDIGPWMICKNVYCTEGFKGFFHGLIPTFAREIPGYFCFFGAYEFSQHIFMKWGDKVIRPKDELTLVETGVCGAIAGIALWIVIFHFDLVKSRIQISSGLNSSSESLPKMLYTIMKKEGIRSLYKGLGPTVVRTIPATAALFIAVEYTWKLMDKFSSAVLS